jgi:hypothetical protein
MLPGFTALAATEPPPFRSPRDQTGHARRRGTSIAATYFVASQRVMTPDPSDPGDRGAGNVITSCPCPCCKQVHGILVCCD